MRNLANLGLFGEIAEHDNGWADEMNANLLKLSTLVQLGVLGRVAAVPGSPAEGDTYVLTAAPNAQAVAVYDGGAWSYFSPSEGWLVYDRGTNSYISFDGAAWVVLETGGGGTGTTFSATKAEAGTAVNLAAADAGKYIRFTATSAKTLTVRPNSTEALPADAEWHMRNVGATELTLVAGSGVTISVPANGSLVIPVAGTATLKRVAEDVFDLFGVTVAA